MSYESKNLTGLASVLELQMATESGRDAYLNHFKSISTPGNGLTFSELAVAYKSLWERGITFPTRQQLMANVGTL